METLNDQKQFSFQVTTAMKKVFALRKRIRAVKGGTSASKTISIAVWHIDYCQQKRSKPTISTIASQSFPHLERGVIRDFISIMKDRGYWKRERWNATKNIYTFETGNVLEFMSVDTYDKAHGPRRDTLFLNECNSLPWQIVDQLILRTRGIVWMDWNPSEEFWFHSEILPYREDDLEYITLTYLDNEALDEISVREIESHKHNTQWWNVYGLGLEGTTESRIYPTWEVLDEIPEEARHLRTGLDFGYAKDPSALVDVYGWNKCYILDEVLYEKEYTNDMLARKIGKNKPLTIADSAEPKSIREIAMHGVNIIGSKKGKGSISHGIDSMRSHKIYVTKRSLNIIKENKNYKYKIDKNGVITNTPEDVLNHAMDAARYAIADLNPEPDPADEYVEPAKGDYETPGLSSAVSKAKSMPVPTLSMSNSLTHKERMQALLDRRNKPTEEYETDTPWQPPGV